MNEKGNQSEKKIIYNEAEKKDEREANTKQEKQMKKGKRGKAQNENDIWKSQVEKRK